MRLSGAIVELMFVFCVSLDSLTDEALCIYISLAVDHYLHSGCIHITVGLIYGANCCKFVLTSYCYAVVCTVYLKQNT